MRSIFNLFFAFYFPIMGMGTQILLLPSSVEELSMGSHPTSAGLSSFNPALSIALKKGPYLTLNRGNWFGGVALTQIGYNLKINKGITHFGLKYFGLDDLEFRNNIPEDDPLSSFNAYGLLLNGGMSFKRSVHRYGFTFSYIQFGVYTENSKGLSLNIGYAMKLNNELTLGFSMQNIGAMSEFYLKNPSLPRRISFGISKKIRFEQYQNEVFGSFELNSIISSYKLNFGNHFQWNRFNIYTGYSISENVTESSAGVGLKMDQYQITYGIRMGSQGLGLPSLLSLRILLP
tara:strand:+ start:677 stop:1543 length:867 start_codon:yes stop_codon:yes gene_type:complete